MKEMTVYKKIWKGVAITYALNKQEEYTVNRKFIVYKGVVYTLNYEGTKLLKIDKDRLYDKLEKDGFEILEYVYGDMKNTGSVDAYFTITKENIEAQAKDKGKKKRYNKWIY